MAETVEQLSERARATTMVPIAPADRRAFAVAPVLQGYDAPRAHRMAYDEAGDIQDNDGALQMLARHRLAETERCAQFAYQWWDDEDADDLRVAIRESETA